MRIKFIALIQAAVLALMVPVMNNVQTVSAEDYCIELTIETLELPINYIEKDRVAYIPIKVSNNPGIDYLSFVVEKDERITEDAGAVSYPDFPFGVELQSMTNTNDRYIGVTAGYGFGDYYYDTDGLFCAIKVVLPENCSVGDYYSFNFYPDGAGSQRHMKFKKDGMEYGKECFSYVNGGIKIVDAVSYGDTPEFTTPAETEPPVTNNNQPQDLLEGDVNGDEIVNARDLVILKQYLLLSVKDNNLVPGADINQSGKIDVFDLQKLVNILLG